MSMRVRACNLCFSLENAVSEELQELIWVVTNKPRLIETVLTVSISSLK